MKYTLEKTMSKVGEMVFFCPLQGFAHQPKSEVRQLKLDGFRKSMILPKNHVRAFFNCSLGRKFETNLGGFDQVNVYDRSLLVLSAEQHFVNEDSIQTTLDFNVFVYGLLFQLWKQKDHSVNLELSYLGERKGSDEANFIRSIDRSWYSNREGKDTTKTVFSHKEIVSAVERINKIQETDYDYFTRTAENTSRTSGTTRAKMFSIWIDDARRAPDVFIKISKYITALESLFATSSAELSHQLSERVALLLPPSSVIEPIQVYLDMKKCYSLRSSALHGDPIKVKDLADLPGRIEFLDNVCRIFCRELESNGPISTLARSSDQEIDTIVRDNIFRNG